MSITLEESFLKSDRRSVFAMSSPVVAVDAEESAPLSAETLLRKSHRVLLNRMPGAWLPDNLSRVRALLDAHMFGRDNRSSRDEIVEVARQIDRTRRQTAS